LPSLLKFWFRFILTYFASKQNKLFVLASFLIYFFTSTESKIKVKNFCNILLYQFFILLHISIYTPASSSGCWPKESKYLKMTFNLYWNSNFLLISFCVAFFASTVFHFASFSFSFRLSYFIFFIFEVFCWQAIKPKMNGAPYRERAGGSGGGAKSYDGKKAWSSINHSILSGLSNYQRRQAQTLE
jgi:hypothetical protein